MSLASLLDYFGEQRALASAPEYARQKFGNTNPEMVALAEADPRLFRQILPGIIGAELDPEKQMKRNALSMIGEMIGVGQRGQGTAAPQTSQLGSVGDLSPEMPVPQELPAEQPQRALGSPQLHERLLAVMNPAAYLEWKLQEPQRQAELAEKGIAAKERETKIQKEQAERSMAATGLTQGFDTAMSQINDLIGAEGQEGLGGTLGEAYGQVSPLTTGRLGTLGRWTGGTDSINLDKNLTVLKANNLISTLKSLKDASPTGASGFGSLTEKEGEKLESLVVSLDPQQDDKQLKAKLVKLNEHMKGVRERLKTAYQKDIQALGSSPSSGGALSKASSQQIQYFDNPTTGEKKVPFTKVNGKWVRMQ